MEFEFHGQYEKDEYFKAIFLAGKPSRRNIAIRMTVFLLLLACLIAYWIGLQNEGTLTGMRISRLLKYAFSLLVILYFVFQPYINIRETSNRLWKDPVIRRQISGGVSNLGIRYENHTQNWETFSHKFMTDDLVVLITSDRLMSCLPRHFFTSDEDWHRVCKIIENRVIEAK
jgi:hypothetical protein